MNALAVVSIYVVTNRAPYLKCDPSVSVYVAVVWIPDHPPGPDLREGLCQTMLLVTRGEVAVIDRILPLLHSAQNFSAINRSG